MKDVPTKLQELFSILNRKSEPSIEIGGHCSDPFDCDYIGYCWSHIPDYSVYNIFGGQKLEQLLAQGIVDPKDVPDNFNMTDRERIQIQSYKNRKIYADRSCIKDFLDSLIYPFITLITKPLCLLYRFLTALRHTSKYPFNFRCIYKKKRTGRLNILNTCIRMAQIHE